MSEMKRPCLDYAALPDVTVSQMTQAQQLICKIAWIGDNSAYGVEDAVKRLIDDVRAGVFSGWVYRPTTVAKPEALSATPPEWSEWLKHAEKRDPDDEVRLLNYRDWTAILRAATQTQSPPLRTINATPQAGSPDISARTDEGSAGVAPAAWRVWAKGRKFTRGIYENPSAESFAIWKSDGDEAEPLYTHPPKATE